MSRGAQILSASSHGRLNFVRWHLIFVGIFSVKLPSLRPSGAWNFKVAPKVLKNLYTPTHVHRVAGTINLRKPEIVAITKIQNLAAVN